MYRNRRLFASEDGIYNILVCAFTPCINVWDSFPWIWTLRFVKVWYDRKTKKRVHHLPAGEQDGVPLTSTTGGVYSRIAPIDATAREWSFK